jgi:hypothetical protein
MYIWNEKMLLSMAMWLRHPSVTLIVQYNIRTPYSCTLDSHISAGFWEVVTPMSSDVHPKRICNLPGKTRVFFTFFLFVYLFLFLCSTVVWTQHLHLQPLHQPFLWWVFFRIMFCKLFARIGFEPVSSWSLPSK